MEILCFEKWVCGFVNEGIITGRDMSFVERRLGGKVVEVGRLIRRLWYYFMLEGVRIRTR